MKQASSGVGHDPAASPAMSAAPPKARTPLAPKPFPTIAKSSLIVFKPQEHPADAGRNEGDQNAARSHEI
jgi:hypothetical protein